MFDSIIIGAGPAGYELGLSLASEGQSVCIIEKNIQNIGGTCLNEGCIPAKNFLEVASYHKKYEYFKSCGLHKKFENFNLSELQGKTNNLIDDLRKGILSKLNKQKIDIKYGKASFVNKNTIEIRNENNTERIEAKNIIIASGSKHKNHPTINLHQDKIISSKEVFTLKDIPKSILIIGGGAIGCEFASFFNSFDCEVLIAEFTPKLVPTEDDDISRTLKRELEKQGINVALNTNVKSYEILDNCINVTLETNKKIQNNSFDKILVSIGRIPNTQDLNLENANIKHINNFIDINEKYQSVSNTSIYAIGDAINSPALAHVAYYEAKRLAQIILNKNSLNSQYIFPSVTFSTPQVASIGKSEKILKEEKVNYKVKKIFFKSNAKAKIKGDDSGFIKILHNIDTNVVVGASIIGNDATELIHQFLIIINTKTTINNLNSMIFAHPTLSEAILE